MIPTTPSILFAEPEFSWSAPLRQELQARGVRVLLADSLREIREIAERRQPAVAIVGGDLADGGRVEVLDALTRSAPRARLIVVDPPDSPSTAEIQRFRILHLGARPADPKSLVEMIEPMLPERAERRRPRPPLVLCVDDEPLYLRSIDRILTRYGYRVATFERGDEALQALPELAPDMAIVDIMMPGLNGLNLADEIIEVSGGRVPVVLLTGRASDQDIIEGYRHGATYYITKPCSPRTVINIVDYLVGGFDRLRREYLETQL